MNWIETRLSSVLSDARSGTWGSPPKNDGEDLSVLRSTNIHNADLVLDDVALRSVPKRSVEKYQLQDGDIIVTTSSGSKRLIGKNAIFQQPEDGFSYLFSNFTQRLRPNRDMIVPRYLYYYLNSSRAKAELLRIQRTTSGLRNLNVPLYLTQIVPLPSNSEQQRIVEILDQASALRKKRAEADKKADRILPALFYKMFGDPATNPKKWPKMPLGDISLARPQYGANASAIPYQEGMPRYVRITDITEVGDLNDNNIKTLQLEDWEQYVLQEGDLLFARSGATVGKTYLYDPDDGYCAYAGYLIRFRIDPKRIDPIVVSALTHTPYYYTWVASKQRTAAQPNINGHEYASFPVPIPSKESQRTFVKAVCELRNLSKAQSDSKARLDRLFDCFLYRAFSGDLTAEWREAHLNELLVEMEEQARVLGIAN